LNLSGHQQIEFLIGAAKLDVGFKRNRVVTLSQGVEQLVHANRRLSLKPLFEVVTLQQLGDRRLSCQTNKVVGAEFCKPFVVESDFGALSIEQLEDLLFVGLGVLVDLFAGQRGSGCRAPGGIADHPGEIADQKNDRVTELLEVPHLADEHGVTEVNVGRSWVEAGLHAQRFSGFCGSTEPFRRKVICSSIVIVEVYKSLGSKPVRS